MTIGWRSGASGSVCLRWVAGMAALAVLLWGTPQGTWAAGKTGSQGKKGPKKSDSAETKSHENEHDDAEPEHDEDVSALVVPIEKLGNVKKIDRMKFGQEVRALLIDGAADPTDGAATAKRHFEAAHRLVPNDPRAAYALGVVFLKHHKPKEALAQFQAAVQSQSGFLPGLEGTAWVESLRGEHKAALTKLRELARQIQRGDDSWPSAHDREHSAEWLGRFIAYLSGPGKDNTDKSDEQSASVAALSAEIEDLLTGARKLAYEQGQKAVALRWDELKAQAARPVEEVIKEAREKRQELSAAATAAEADVKRIEAEIRDIKKPADKQVADLNRDLRDNANKAKRAERELEGAEEAVEDLAMPRAYPKVTTYGRYRIPRISARAETSQEKKNREQALSQAKQNLSQLQTSLQQAKDAMADIKKQRDEAKADARRAAAGKLEDLSAARRRSQELSARAKEAEQGLTAEQVKARPTALESYVPFDADAQKNRLLDSLKSHSND